MHCVEGYRNDEYYENILCEAAAAIEQENDSAPSARRAGLLKLIKKVDILK